MLVLDQKLYFRLSFNKLIFDKHIKTAYHFVNKNEFLFTIIMSGIIVRLNEFHSIVSAPLPLFLIKNKIHYNQRYYLYIPKNRLIELHLDIEINIANINGLLLIHPVFV